MRMESPEMQVKNLREQIQGMAISHEQTLAQRGEYRVDEQKRTESLEKKLKELGDMLRDSHDHIKSRFDRLDKRAGEENTEIKATLDLLIANTTSGTAPDGGGSRTKTNEAKESYPETPSNDASLQLYVQGWPKHWEVSRVGSRFENQAHCKIVSIEPRGYGGCAIFTFLTEADRAKAMKCNGEFLHGSPYTLLVVAVGAHRQRQVKTVGQQAQGSGSNRVGALPISQMQGPQAAKNKLERRSEEEDEGTKANERRIFVADAAGKARRLFVQETFDATPGLCTSELRIRAKQSGFGCNQSKTIVRGFLELQKQSHIRPKRAEQNKVQPNRFNIPPGGFLSGSAKKRQGAPLSSQQADVPGDGVVTVTGISSAEEKHAAVEAKDFEAAPAVKEKPAVVEPNAVEAAPAPEADSPSKVSSLFAGTTASKREAGIGGGGMDCTKEELASQIRETHSLVDCLWKVNGKGIEKSLVGEGKTLVNVRGTGACGRLAVMVTCGIPEEEIDDFQKKCHDFTEDNWLYISQVLD